MIAGEDGNTIGGANGDAASFEFSGGRMIPPGPVPATRPDPVPARREPAGPVPAEVLPPKADSVPAAVSRRLARSAQLSRGRPPAGGG